MTGSRFTRFGGVIALLGGTLWVASFAAAQAISSDLKGIVVGPVLLMLISLAALQARHASGSGKVGKAGFGLTLLGLVLLAYGSVGRAVITGEVAGLTYGPLYFAGMAPGAFVLGAGAIFFAASVMGANVLPRLSSIPLLIGSVGVAAGGGISLAHQLLDGSAADVFPLQPAPLAALWVVFGVGWLWLGYLLWSERTPGAERVRAALLASERSQS